MHRKFTICLSGTDKRWKTSGTTHLLKSVIPRIRTSYKMLQAAERNPFALVACFEELFIVSVEAKGIPCLNASAGRPAYRPRMPSHRQAGARERLDFHRTNSKRRMTGSNFK
jgi:hypothetical protein